MTPRNLVLPVAFTLLLGSALVFGRPAQGEVEIRVQPVAGAVHVAFGQGGNIGLSVGDDGVLMVDDQFAQLAAKIEAAIDALSDAPVSLLVNTHWHGDHTGGNEHFGAMATILAHDNVRRRLVDAAPPMPEVGRPTITYADGVSIHFNGEEIRVLHVPTGHTDGDSVVWFTGSKVVHMGDLFFQASYPYVDLGSGGDVHGLIAACKRVLALVPADTKVIPGHGQVTDPAGLREYVAMLEEVVTRVQHSLGAGMTAQQMLDDGLLADFEPRWGGGGFMPAERFLPIVAQNLAQKRSKD